MHLQIFIEATKLVSQSRNVLIHQVIQIIDQIHDNLMELVTNQSLHAAVRYAANTALLIFNKYYSKTDECDIYRIATSAIYYFCITLN